MRTSAALLLGFLSQVSLATPLVGSDCSQPHWASLPESRDGFFHGDLAMECSVHLPKGLSGLEPLKNGIIEKIRGKSIVHTEPSPEALKASSALRWDVSHRIDEDGNNVTIREEALLDLSQKDGLSYSTRSKEVTAAGMAGFLKVVNFSMKLRIKEGLPESLKGPLTVQIEFKNEVKVEQPWYAIEFIFTPIAKNICLEKMEKVRTQLLPWVVSFLAP